MNGNVFLAYVEQVLAPTLSPGEPGLINEDEGRQPEQALVDLFTPAECQNSFKALLCPDKSDVL
ncbi:hypothetical protein [Mesorhizobium sp. WSM1293]|uniref:hypothetical protein n=1 Tax=Mesorhizobium sp. WSM1293 TaxID=1040984 RepID=UPI0012EC8BD0|nr:hypothetical protein [Mesorhizobium sp. WSM1293]